EKITEYGIGNGSSLIITAGIVARMPQAAYVEVKRLITAAPEERPFLVVSILLLATLFVVVVLCVVYITRGERRIPIQQARTVKGRRVYGGVRHFMPLRVNSAGVLPIIFAQSLVVIPAGFLKWVFPGSTIPDMIRPGAFWYYILYLALIGFFTYFWTSLTFNPVEIANNIKEHGSFIPGIRPGRRTAEYLERILNRITLAGATFLALIALVPQIVSSSIGVTAIASSFLGGTGILIVVGVALDLVDKVEAQLLVRHYDGFMRKSGEA
ncbi:MAG: preprotein translocase subunit SecY, partial [Planctomycetes bacterium]|nr:preprotein translocase subunit SecY [Planctomycetota bacterium]